MSFQSFRSRLLKQRRFRQLLFGSVMFSIGIGILIVPIEQQVGYSSIVNYSDGFWWTIQTLTTVGYGDVVPVTPLGRFLGVIMQIVGTVMFGSLIALISSSMSRRQEEFYWSRLFERLDRLEKTTEEIEKRTNFLIKDTAHPKPFSKEN